MSPSTRTDVQRGLSKELSVCVSKRYSASGHSRFRLDVQFSVQPGVTVLLGHSGAGKTTLLRCIAGLCNPDQGRIAIAGNVIFAADEKICLEPARRNIAFVFQDLALFPHLTVQGNVAYGLRRLPAAEREQRIDIILNSFQIAHLRTRLPCEISGGEQQRVALARSLVTEPSVLLLDEPLSSLDLETKSKLIDDLRAWNEAHRIPIIYVTHNHEEVLALGERATVLEQGRIVADGSPVDVVSAVRRQALAQSSSFENLFEATVVGSREQEGTLTCRLAGTSVELQAPLTWAELGTRLRLGISAHEILCSSVRPEMVGAYNVVPGYVNSLEEIGRTVQVRVNCGAEFRVHLPVSSGRSYMPDIAQKVWLVIKIGSCHVFRIKGLNALQRLFVFVCGGNTSRSPMAQAICNALIAKRLKVPLESLPDFGVQALSAGLSAHPGTPITKEAQDALRRIGIPSFHCTARNLDAEMVEKAEVIFCMTAEQCKKAAALFPHGALKIQRLWADRDIDDPQGKDQATFLNLAALLRNLIHKRLGDLEPIAAGQI